MRKKPMKLYTEAYDPDWDRILDMTVEKTEGVSEYMTDNTVFKVILHEKGEIKICKEGNSVNIKNPSMIILSDADVTECRSVQKGNNIILYFKPSVIRDEFTSEALKVGKYEDMMGTTVFQDYLLIRDFFMISGLDEKIFPLSLNELNKVKGLIDSIESELTTQYDGFWPCRSRSYLMELLFYIRYRCAKKEEEKRALFSEDDNIYSNVCNYLNEHLNENLTLETITKEFNINRNKLNGIFISKTSKTCLNYLMDLRMDMARIMLSNTEIPIGEISVRSGFLDANYFTKAFKKHFGMTPREYRKTESSSCTI